MRYVLAKNHEKFEEKAYRIYVTDTLRALTGTENNPRYVEWIDTTPPETRTADEIINHIKDGLRKL